MSQTNIDRLKAIKEIAETFEVDDTPASETGDCLIFIGCAQKEVNIITTGSYVSSNMITALTTLVAAMAQNDEIKELIVRAAGTFLHATTDEHGSELLKALRDEK